MKKIILLLTSVVSVHSFAASTSAKNLSARSVAPVQTSTSVINSAPVQSAQILKPAGHVFTSINSLATWHFNLSANLFANEKAAFSLGYFTSSEKTEPLTKNNFNLTDQVNVETTQTTVGAAYYFVDHDRLANLALSPFVLFQRRTDSNKNENTTGVGMRVDGIYKINHLAFNAGVKSTLVLGQSESNFTVGAGYIF
jgi:hypothetical protein